LVNAMCIYCVNVNMYFFFLAFRVCVRARSIGSFRSPRRKGYQQVAEVAAASPVTLTEASSIPSLIREGME